MQPEIALKNPENPKSMINRRNLVQSVSLGMASMAATGSFSQASELMEIPLWPGDAPGEVAGEVGEEKIMEPLPNQKRVNRLSNVTRPRLTVHPSKSAKKSDATVIICPGGGYNILADEHEGTMVADWLNGLGINAFVLRYRVPRRKGKPMYEAPLQDAQRAIRLVRQNAAKWEINPDKIGILGFSAGGHLTAMASTAYDREMYQLVDEADRISARPDASMLIYPAYLAEKGQLSEDVKITKQTPPAFLVHAHDDPLSSESSVLYYLALKRLNTPAELHVYAKGGHGYGMVDQGLPTSHWPDRCAEWLKVIGWMA
jgi:acetyl esterase/lipase